MWCLSGKTIYPEGGAVSLHLMEEIPSVRNPPKTSHLSDRKLSVQIMCSDTEACWTSSAGKDVQI